MVDAAHDKEKKDKETIRKLQEDVSNLTKMAEIQTGFSRDQEQKCVCGPFFFDCTDVGLNHF